MKASRRKLAAFIADRSLHGKFGAREVTELAAYLLQEKRTNELGSLLRDVEQVLADRGIINVVATSAHELSTQDRRDVEALARRLYPKAEQLVVTTRLDPTLVGGVRLAFPDRRFDASVAGRLEQFKRLAVQGKEA